MKKFVLVLILAVMATATVSAKEKPEKDTSPDRFRPKYRNISFVSQKRIYENAFKSDKTKFGFAFTTGRSYILHKNPLVGMIRIGLDATWFDINYGMYQTKALNTKYTMHQADISMGIGPSVHVNPIGKLGVHSYFRYNPTFATFFDTTDGFAMGGGYSSVFVTGGAVSWGVISVGVEARWGKGTYHTLFGGGDEEGGEGDDIDLGDYFSVDKMKLKTSGFRVYLGFRF